MMPEQKTFREFGGEAIVEDDGVTCTICRLHVHPLLRRQGVGTKLLKDVYWWARKRKRSYLRVSPVPESEDMRDALLRFYKRNGFHTSSDNDVMLKHL